MREIALQLDFQRETHDQTANLGLCKKEPREHIEVINQPREMADRGAPFPSYQSQCTYR
jgi:hypothetical protein